MTKMMLVILFYKGEKIKMRYCRQDFLVDDVLLTCSISEANVCIYKSYQIKSRKSMKNAIKMIRDFAEKEQGITFERTEKEWLQEWRAHNLLYAFDYQTARTANVDLNENEPAVRKSLYKILSFVYTFIHK